MKYRKELAEGFATPQEVQEYLSGKAVWMVGDAARYLNVTTGFYRNNILNIPDHPSPLDPRAGNLKWWSRELAPWLSDTANLKKR